MGFIAWVAVIGILLTSISLGEGVIRHLPMSIFAVYLIVGIGMGPWGFDVVSVDLNDHAEWLERLTEIALIISLFIGGLNLRVPWSASSARVARRLAFPAMALSVAGVAAAGHWLLALDWPLALILGAMLAPTDPVLASVIAVSDASDRDGLRVALSGEAGLNDGTAMPFLLLGIALLHQEASWQLVGHWAAVDLLWGLCAGSLLGFTLGWAVGQLSTRLRSSSPRFSPGAMLSLGLIAITYAAAQSINALGFVAVFCAGAGMRLVELRVSRRAAELGRHADGSDSRYIAPAEMVNESTVSDSDVDPGAGKPVEAVGHIVSDALKFGDVLEQILGPMLVLLLGIAVARYWRTDGIIIMLVLFFLIRPAATWICTIGMGLPWQRRVLFGWLGIRGIGTLNYLAYALTHGLKGPPAALITGVAVTVVTLSVLLHGLSAHPLMAYRSRAIARNGGLKE